MLPNPHQVFQEITGSNNAPNPHQVTQEDLPSSWRFSFLLRIRYYQGICRTAITTKFIDVYSSPTTTKGVLHAERINF